MISDQGIVKAALLACAAIWAAASSALASSEDVFVVPRVAVQAQADSAREAKTIAQNEGRRRAMDLLLKRLTVEENWPQLPQLAASEAGTESPTASNDALFEPAPAVGLTTQDLQELESGFEVYNEKSSSRTYRAFITYRFKPDAVRRLLKDAQIPYSEAQTQTALVIPVLQTGSGLYLWEENNPWMAAWKIRPYNNELTPMIAPLGDLEDAAGLSARQALDVDVEALQAIADRYSVSNVVIAHAFLQQANGDDKIRVRLINGYNSISTLNDVGAGEDAFASEIDAGEAYSPAGDFGQAQPGDDFLQNDPGDVLAEAWFSQPSGNFPTLAERAIEETISKYAKPWKERTLIDHSVSALLNVSARYNSLAEWGKIRAALVSTPLVGSVQVRSLSRSGSEMLIQAFGEPEKLIVSMEAQGLVLWSDDGELWNVATPDAAQQYRNADRRQQSRRSDDEQSSRWRSRFNDALSAEN
ncbi:MAG: DUF2066 domain-containing protein [Pseudomonadota bacterium]